MLSVLTSKPLGAVGNSPDQGRKRGSGTPRQQVSGRKRRLSKYRRYFHTGSAVLIVLLAAAFDATAGRIFSYTDEHGVVHYTDRPPNSDAKAEIAHFKPEPVPALRTHRRGSDHEPEWVFENRIHGPLEVEVSLTEHENIRTEPPLPRRFMVPAHSQVRLFEIGPRNPGQGWSYRFATRYTPGDPGARHDENVTYQPPFSRGAAYTVGQAFGGGFSHNDPQNWHAVDIAMPVGTPIHAARAGVVMEMERWFDEGGGDRDRYLYQSNYIRILHEDGTMAVYGHLDYRGTVVHPGQVVLEGDKIGRSGNTGFTTGPHLHFVVQRNAGMRLESVPIRFRGENGQAVVPEAGERLTHFAKTGEDAKGSL